MNQLYVLPKDTDSIVKHNAIVDKLYNHLIKIGYGGKITYDELNRIAECDVCKKKRFILQKAIDRALDDNITFATIRKVGLIRLDLNGVIEKCDRNIVILRRKANKAKKQIQLGIGDKYDELSREQKVKFNVNLSLLGAIRQFAMEKSKAKITKNIEDKPLDFENTLKLFK